MTLRRLHAYLAVFAAPSILFFALTGALQLFSLHEPHGDYRPAAVIEKLGMLHKDQVYKVRGRRPPPPAPPAEAAATPAPHPQPEQHGPGLPTVALKWFFLLADLCLIGSTCLGAWLGLRHTRPRGLVWTLFVLGAAIPTMLAAF